MRQVRITATDTARDASVVYPIICDFERYPELTDAVVSVEVSDLGDGRSGCTWEVKFRRGILRWSEEDHFDPERHRVEYSLIEGDIDAFTGHWQIHDSPEGCRIEFLCSFDMGIPTLAHMIEPIAAETLRENVILILRGLLGGVIVDEPDEAGNPSPAPAAGRR